MVAPDNIVTFLHYRAPSVLCKTIWCKVGIELWHECLVLCGWDNSPRHFLAEDRRCSTQPRQIWQSGRPLLQRCPTRRCRTLCLPRKQQPGCHQCNHSSGCCRSVWLSLSLLIHSFIMDNYIVPLQVPYYSEVLPTLALILCQGWHVEALQAIASEGLAQGSYVVANMGFELATLRMQGSKPATELPCSTNVLWLNVWNVTNVLWLNVTNGLWLKFKLKCHSCLAFCPQTGWLLFGLVCQLIHWLADRFTDWHAACLMICILPGWRVCGLAHCWVVLFAVKPVFTLKPGNITTKDGVPVMLHCRASGEPVPTIRWDRMDRVEPFDLPRIKVRFPLQVSKQTSWIRRSEFVPGNCNKTFISAPLNYCHLSTEILRHIAVYMYNIVYMFLCVYNYVLRCVILDVYMYMCVFMYMCVYMYTPCLRKNCAKLFVRTSSNFDQF